MSRQTLRGKIDSNDPRLSPREKDVILCYNEGVSYSFIADKFSISVGGVKSHITSARKKTGVLPCTKN